MGLGSAFYRAEIPVSATSGGTYNFEFSLNDSENLDFDDFAQHLLYIHFNSRFSVWREFDSDVVMRLNSITVLDLDGEDKILPVGEVFTLSPWSWRGLVMYGHNLTREQFEHILSAVDTADRRFDVEVSILFPAAPVEIIEVIPCGDSVTVKLNRRLDDEVLMVAIFEDGVFLNVSVAEAQVEEFRYAAEFAEIPASGVTIKAFAWESMQNLNPLGDFMKVEL